MNIRWSCLIVLCALALGPRNAAAEPAAEASPPPTSTSPAFPDARVRAWQTGILRPHRIQHVSFAYTSGVMVGLTSREPGLAFGSALVLGLAKEIWDIRRSGFDWVDLGADALGAAGAAATTVTLGR